LRGVPQFIENMEAAPFVSSSAEAPYTRPGVGLLEYAIDDFDGDQVLLLDGYTPVVEELARPLQEAGLIETKTQVESIDWSDSPIKIQTNNGAYKAKTVVLSIPLGVLKERHKTLCEPPLPKDRQEAIDSLGFGTLDKIFLVYSHAWWAEEPYSSFFKSGKRLNASPDDNSSNENNVDTFMGFTHDLSGLSIFPSKPIEPGPRILSFINLHALTGYPVLGVFVSCSNALTIEKMSDEKAGHLAHSNFVSWLPSHLPTPPKPEAVHVTRWAADEFSRGSYSHMITGVSELRHREEFQTPLRSGKGGKGGEGDKGGEVRFAGEHTSSNHFATAHGALISGWREADGIIAAAEP
jgi:monoamine oxidase